MERQAGRGRQRQTEHLRWLPTCGIPSSRGTALVTQALVWNHIAIVSDCSRLQYTLSMIGECEPVAEPPAAAQLAQAKAGSRQQAAVHD